MMEVTPDDKKQSAWWLAAAGGVSIAGFLTVFLNIPWEWNMFMDDIYYTTWMPKTGNLYEAFLSEIKSYWQLGRFYPVKYLANLLKWHFLPTDPAVFRIFNLAVFGVAVIFGAAAAVRSSRREAGTAFAFCLFLAGASFLHKPLLEIISLNPLGETWVCLFFFLGSYFLFSKNFFSASVVSRLFFVLVCLSKEPAALVFFGSALRYALLWATADKDRRRRYFWEGLIDAAIFCFFLALAVTAMSQGSFTKGAYFSQTPWFLYARDFAYKVVRYAIWTSPFILLFALKVRRIPALLKADHYWGLASAVFFLSIGLGYLVFMSTQGIVAYQEIPASMAFFGLFGLLSALLWQSGDLGDALRRYGFVLLALFSVSYVISVGRWERFVRGIVEPNRAVSDLLSTGQEMTLLLPVGELQWHVGLMAEKLNPQARIISLAEAESDLPGKLKGTIYLFEFPYYMGPVDPAILSSRGALVDGWAAVFGKDSYRVYRGNKKF